MHDDEADERFVADLLRARDAARITARPSQCEVGFDLSSGYRVGRALHQRLVDRGYRAVGRKIGFTNPATWREFDVNMPIWAPVYTQTTHFADHGTLRFALNGTVAPRLEPEIVLKLRSPLPDADLSPEAVARCVEWAAVGFEIVDAHYPEWRVTGADAVADFGVHAALIVGTPWYLESEDPAHVAATLQALTVVLRRGSEDVAQGEGRNALGSPLLALGYLARVLATQDWAPPLEAGEVITTGTLTPLPYISHGETWNAEVAGAPLQPLTVDLYTQRGP